MKVFYLRETGRGKTFFDQDLVVIGAKLIPIETINGLKFEFLNSNLPILVDIVNWNAILKNFVKKLQDVV
ncbi:hypothetical protein [Coxiella-like endosymbiont of Rhipicephalus sanguineus]|uniref:hypothetical protein n=1 Tax=Coxiella-like endosymbiont of Rhipicephalus sanguineus TaxID=1955402 RepID=UPI00203BD6CE|nr:hypothetical protein [Coxiella-like endosymbiont of Rhipicephalus sanguineus]